MRIVVASFALVVGCSSSSTPTGSPSDATSDATSEGGGSFECPPTEPAAGSPCTTPGPGLYACEYGGDSHGLCTHVYACATQKAGEALHWIAYEVDPTCGVNPSDCPTSFGAKDGQSCGTAGEACEYDEGVCGCERCQSDAGTASVWRCRAWKDAAPGCPTPRPLLGTACTTEGLGCDYDHCCDPPGVGPSQACTGGEWVVAPSGVCSCAIPTCP